MFLNLSWNYFLLTDDFALVDKRRWKIFAGSVSFSLSDDSSWWCLMVMLRRAMLPQSTHTSHTNRSTHRMFSSRRALNHRPLISSIKVHFDDGCTQMIKVLFVAGKRGSQADFIIAALGKQIDEKEARAMIVITIIIGRVAWWTSSLQPHKLIRSRDFHSVINF